MSKKHFGHEAKKFWNLGKSFRQGFQNFNLRGQRKILVNFTFQKNITNFHGLKTINCRTLGEKLPAVMSAFYLSGRTVWVFKKLSMFTVHSDLADRGDKSLHSEGKLFL